MDPKVAAAAESLAITLDDWPTAEAVLQLLGERRDWKKLARAHRLLLVQQPDPEREGKLWRGLAVLYRDQLHDDESAIEIYRFLSKRTPTDVADCLHLAMLHERSRRVVEALEVLDDALQRLPDRPELYRRRFELCAAMGDVDGAWRAAAALFLLKKVEDLDHANFYVDHELREPRTPLRDLTADDFLSLRHPDESVVLSGNLARLASKRPRRTIEQTRTQEELYLLVYYRLCDLFPQYELIDEPVASLSRLTRGAVATADLEKWQRGARISCACAAALLVGDVNLLEEVLARDPNVRDATAACFASALFGRLRADLGLGLTPPA